MTLRAARALAEAPCCLCGDFIAVTAAQEEVKRYKMLKELF